MFECHTDCDISMLKSQLRTQTAKFKNIKRINEWVADHTHIIIFFAQKMKTYFFLFSVYAIDLKVMNF